VPQLKAMDTSEKETIGVEDVAYWCFGVRKMSRSGGHGFRASMGVSTASGGCATSTTTSSRIP
jgi:hypothetical protein